MAETVGDHLLRRLREWGVEQVFAYPGDGINGIVASFEKAGNQPRFVQARHEEMAAFEAVGYAKFSGQVGICMATSGPGAIHLLNGLYDAKPDHVPVVAIDTSDQLAPAWDRAFSVNRPTVLDVRCDPEVPPIPPHATFEQMKPAAQAVLKGDPNAWHLMAQGLKTKAQEILPGTSS
ncbi:hypothetical protein GCM10017788_01610 [Amycolatopsis acidiphila]|nr:hypothetical protein GCM10017788_01610 [Amycolatopsis acidiphila]